VMTSLNKAAKAIGIAVITSTLSAIPAMAIAGPVLLINGASATHAPNVTNSITTQLSNLHTAAGNTVTVADAVPGDLSPYEEVWDMRFSNRLAISAAEEAQFLRYLQAGNGMFVMGESLFVPSRNRSVRSLIAAAGGGDLNFGLPFAQQTVIAPFDTPNPVSIVGYRGATGVGSPGTGQFITVDALRPKRGGTGVAFGVGDLANAPLGALIAVFDADFMMTDAPQSSQNLTANLIAYMGDQVNPDPVPEPALLSMLGVGLAAFAIARRRPRQ